MFSLIKSVYMFLLNMFGIKTLFSNKDGFIKGNYEEFLYNDKKVVIFPIGKDGDYGLYTFDSYLNNYVLLEKIENYSNIKNIFKNGYSILLKDLEYILILTKDDDDRSIVLQVYLKTNRLHKIPRISLVKYISKSNNLTFTNICKDAFKTSPFSFIFNMYKDGDDIKIVKGNIKEFKDHFSVKFIIHKFNKEYFFKNDVEIENIKSKEFIFTKKELPNEVNYIGDEIKYYTVTTLVNENPIVNYRVIKNNENKIVITSAKEENEKTPIVRYL